MRTRIFAGAIAAFVFIVGFVSIAAVTSNNSYDSVAATVAEPGPRPPSIDDAGRQVENLADWTTTVNFVQMANFVTFAETYQAHLDAEAAEVAHQKAVAAAAPKQAPAAPRSSVSAPSYSGPSGGGGGDMYARLGQCEAGGNPATNTANGYSGLYQFLDSTWNAYGGQEFAPRAYMASAADQTIVAQRIVASQGGTFQAFPGCRAKLGLP